MNELVDLVAIVDERQQHGARMYTGTAVITDGGMQHPILVHLYAEHVNAIVNAGWRLATDDAGNLKTAIPVIMETQDKIGPRRIKSVQTVLGTMLDVEDRNSKVLHITRVTHKYTNGVTADDFVCETAEGITVHVIRNDLRVNSFHAFEVAGYGLILRDIISNARNGKMLTDDEKPAYVPTKPLPILVTKNERGFWDTVAVSPLDFAEAA